jgi:hypothetical protein
MKSNVSKSELGKRSKNPLGVLFTGTDEKIEVRRISRPSMMRNCECANDEILNLVRVQQFDKLSQVLAERHLDGEDRGDR